MKKLMSSVVLLCAAGGLVGCSTAEPNVVCNMGRGQPYALYFTVSSDPTGCAKTLGGGGQLDWLSIGSNANGINNNNWGLEGYYDDKNANLKEVALYPGEFAPPATPSNTAPVPAGNLAIGNFDAFYPDANKNCTVATFSTATMGGSSYQISSLTTYNDAAHEGTQLHATLQYTGPSNADGTGAACTVTYDVLGTWPAVACSNNADCDPNPAGNPNSTGGNNVIGSGIASDYPTACRNINPVTGAGFCMVKGTYPQLGAFNVNQAP